MDFATQSSDLSISLLHQGIESFTLLSQNLNFVITFRSGLLGGAFSLQKSSLDFFILGTHQFELILKLVHLASGKPEILLCFSDLITKS